MLSPKWLFVYILTLAFLLRIVGVGYGLPMWLIDDEPPFTLAALKMLQLKTLLPATHLEEFRTVLYYPPYISYLYLLPFSILLGIKYLFFNGGQEQFIYYLTSDLSQFFLIARLLNVILGVLSIALFYKVVKKIFQNEFIGLLAAFFLSTSSFHILMSANGRHWLPVSFFIVLVLWILNLDWEFQKRYFVAVLVVGIGMGVSPITLLLLALIGYWYLFYEQKKLLDLFKEKYFYLSLALFGLLAILPGILYPQSFGFQADLTSGQTKSIWGILQSPFLFLKPIALSEPILVTLAIFGLAVIAFYQSRLFWPLSLFIYTYSAVFYWFFRYEHRFTLMLFPILALLAAIGFASIYKWIKNRALVTTLFFLLAVLIIFSLRLSYLLYQNDSRIFLREWTEENIPAGSRIMVFTRLTRLSTTPEAIKEQEVLDPFSLRKIDLAEANFNLPDKKYFHALNLYDVQNQEFYSNLEKYVRDNHYQYLFIGGTDVRKAERLKIFQEIASKGRLLKAFGEFQETYSPSIGQLIGNPFNLFKLEEFGPPVALYKLF